MRLPSARWPCTIHGVRKMPGCARSTRNPLYVPGVICDEIGLSDGDWAWIISHHGRIKCEVARTDAVNGKTMWTWNAIGKRGGAWALEPNSPEATKGLLAEPSYSRVATTEIRWHALVELDLITGQAAWYDLRVRIRKLKLAKGLASRISRR